MLIGLVGCPNSGKSTFFKALTLAEAETANYPFTTIKPNQGVAYVKTECPCKRLGVKCNPNNSFCINGTRFVPVKVLDVAGLVPDAHEGKGLGNQFLSDLVQACGLIHVLDLSGKTDWEGKSVESWDPGKNIKMLEEEITRWLWGIIKKAIEKSKTKSRAEGIPIKNLIAKQLSGLSISESHVKEVLERVEPESYEFAENLRKISKPIVIAGNKIDLNEAKENFERLKRGDLIPCSAEAELALKEAAKKNLIEYIPGEKNFKIISGSLNENQRKALEIIRKEVLEKFGSTGVQDALNHMVFSVLKMIVVYPVANIERFSDSRGNVLPDAYLVERGTTLKEFAKKIHSDIADNFMGGLDMERKKIGADYELKDGDVIQILFKK
ncbi:MAG: redox-regulated ATPase YchF [Candidatus Aenigmatarchaeota archaeon]|nr:MAG: redox-regulated ATPase YchF [Candidatus Aenigmarchaeota archaeon]